MSFSFGSPATAAPQQSNLTTGSSFNFGPAASSTPTGAPAVSGLGAGIQPTNLFGTGTTGGTVATAAIAPNPASTATSTGGLFGSGNPAPPASAPAGTTTQPFSFGQATGAMTTAAPASGLTFGTAVAGAATTTAATGFAFGSTTTQPAAMGTTTTAAPATTTAGFNLGATPAAVTTAASTGFSFGASGPGASTAGITGLSFGPTAATFTNVAPFGFSTNVPNVLAVTTTATGTTSGTVTSGLGGVSHTTSSTESQLPSFGKVEHRGVKEQLVPVELIELVNNLKKHIKLEKLKLTEIARISDKHMEGFSKQADEIQINVTTLSGEIHRQMVNAESFKSDVAQEINNLELALALRDAPPTLQAGLRDAEIYFFDLAYQFQEKMESLQKDITKVEEAVKNCTLENENYDQSPSVTANELTSALLVTKDALIYLCACVHDQHEKLLDAIEAHKKLQMILVGEVKFTTNPKSAEVPKSNAGIGGQIAASYNKFYDKANVYFNPNKLQELTRQYGLPSSNTAAMMGKGPPLTMNPAPFQRSLSGHTGHRLTHDLSFLSGAPSNMSYMHTSTMATATLQPPSPTSGLKRSKH